MNSKEVKEILAKVLEIDIFRKLPKDLSEPTTCGAICK